MTSLILMVIFGIGFALFATQNTSVVIVQLAGTILKLPLYIVAFGSLLVGLFISWIITTINSISTSMALSGRENQLRKTQTAIDNLQTRVHELELENAQLKVKAGFKPLPEQEMHERQIAVEQPNENLQQKSQNFFDRVKHNLNI